MSTYNLADAPVPTDVPVQIAVVVSRYNPLITERLFEGAQDVFNTRTAKGSTLTRIDAPGAFELPALCLAAAATQTFDGVVALGCIIKGETIHDRVIADAVAKGIIDATIGSGVPIAFGVITADSMDQANARAGGAVGNKGSEAMAANLETISTIRALAMTRVEFEEPLPEPPPHKPHKPKKAKKAASKPASKRARS